MHKLVIALLIGLMGFSASAHAAGKRSFSGPPKTRDQAIEVLNDVCPDRMTNKRTAELLIAYVLEDKKVPERIAEIQQCFLEFSVKEEKK